jgi:hypothetical protein
LPNGKARSNERQGEKSNKTFNFNIQKTMKGIMFNEKYGLESAVLNGIKTRTWRADKQPRYEVGEIVAIKQCYRDVMNYSFYNDKKLYDKVCNLMNEAGATNKMFVKNELMPHQIRITSVKKCRLQDLTDIDCMSEGIEERGVRNFRTIEIAYAFRNRNLLYITPKKAFAVLIDKLNGIGYWENNPNGYAYEFEIVK